MRRLVAVVGAVACAALLLPAPAHAFTAPAVWTIATVPAPDGTPLQNAWAARALDCPAPDWCQLLTGYQYVTTLAGHRASTVEPPKYYTQPYMESALVDVACVQVGNCVATGESYEGPWDLPAGYRNELANGTWTAEQGGAWQQVACNPDSCVEIATEDVGVDLGVLDERETGGTWVSRHLSTPWQAGGLYVELDAIGCPPSGPCYVIGSAQDQNSDRRSMVFSRSGSGWHGVPIVEPRGAVPGSASIGDFYEAPHTLTCPSSGVCLALGEYIAEASGQQRLFVEVISHGRLSAHPVPLPGAASIYGAENLSCSSLTECAGTAGLAQPYRGQPQVLLRLHAGRWSFRPVPAPAGSAPGTSPYVATVSCPSAAECVAVGGYSRTIGSKVVGRPAVWTWALGNWTAQALGAPRGVPTDKSGTLDTLECRNDRCVAAGYFDRYHGDYSVYALARLSG